KRMSIFDLGGEEAQDDVNSLAEYADVLKGKSFGPDMEGAMKFILRTKFMGQPMMILPGTWE
ncbi:MAG TPA: signal peptide peptidase SppA, partial [Bdellovibrio sp.]